MPKSWTSRSIAEFDGKLIIAARKQSRSTSGGA